MTETIVYQLLTYPRLIIESMVSIRGVADFIAEILVLLSLWSMGWAVYSNWLPKQKISTFIGGWVLVFSVILLGQPLGVNKVILEFATSTLTVGAILAIVTGAVWRGVEDGERVGLTISWFMIALTILLMILAVITASWRFLEVMALIFIVWGIIFALSPYEWDL